MLNDRRHFLDLARTSRRVAKNVTDKSIADRLEQMANDYEREAFSDPSVPSGAKKGEAS
jgi:hypothetical protein